MNLKIMNPIFSVVKLPPMNPIPSWALDGEIISITRTDEELSIVCPSDNIPVNEVFKDIEGEWKCIKVEGILDFNLTGILSSLANPLAEHKISIFALSTYNTDYLLIKKDSLQEAKKVLEQEGHTFISDR